MFDRSRSTESSLGTCMPIKLTKVMLYSLGYSSQGHCLPNGGIVRMQPDHGSSHSYYSYAC
jgi:hypothetical protein